MKSRKLLSCLLALTLTLGLTAPAFAAEEDAALTAPVMQEPSPWASPALADSYAMGLLDDNYGLYLQSTVTKENLTAMTAIVADKLALLGLPENELHPKELVIDSTRGGVMNALYQEAAAYSLPGIELPPADYLVSLGVVKGGQGGDLMIDKPCTYQEAMVMAQRLILALYDQNDAGSKGLLWKATSGGNTLYLLGTIHIDRGNVYPFHKSLRDAIAASQEAIFEVDFSVAEDVAAFQALQVYSDGTGLKDHISAELYADTVAVCTQLGMTEEQVNSYKPWVLMLTLNSVLSTDSTTSSNAMAMDMYITSSAMNAGKKIGAVETATFQGKIFDGLSMEYQTESLAAYVAMATSAFHGETSDETLTEAEQAEIKAALDHQNTQLEGMMNAWKARDPEAMAPLLDKATVVSGDDEMGAKLFTERDPNMIKAAAAYLDTEGENTFFMAVGAGHMLDPGGIVSGLQKLGYTVELVK